MNSAGTNISRKTQILIEFVRIFLALSLAASMFERNSTDNNTLTDVDADLYILGIKYTTPNGT